MANSYYRGRQARQYNKRWRAYTEKTLAEAEAMIDFAALQRDSPRRPRVLDVACGTGILLQRLLARVPALEASGVDASADMLAQARTALADRPEVSFVQADLNQRGWALTLYAPATFNLITSTNVLHDIVHPAIFLAELRSLLAPGGQLVIEDFAPRRPFWLWAVFEAMLRRVEAAPVRALTLQEAARCCEQAELHVRAQKTFTVNWLWHGWALRAG